MRIKALVVGLVAAVALAVIPSLSGASSTNEQRSARLLNHERTSRGLRALAWNSRAAQVARDHSRKMAADGELRHNSRITSQMSGWSRLGENVGTGTSVDLIHDAFMLSTSHRENILDRRFTQIGIGAATDGDGVIWITQVFFTPMSAQSTTTRSVSTKRSSTTTPKRAAPRARPTTVQRPSERSAPAAERGGKPDRTKARAPLGAHMRPVGAVMPFGG